MTKREGRIEGRIVATGVNAQGVLWKEITFLDEEEKEKQKIKTRNRKEDIKGA